jgi:hypothetical protein
LVTLNEEGGTRMPTIKSEDLIKYITEQVITYIETPAEIRKENRKSMRSQKEAWSSKWFGMVPFAIQMWVSGRRNKKRTPLPKQPTGVPIYRKEEEK